MSLGERYQRRFEQAVMSLSEQYDAAVAKLKHLNVTETADRILYISWLNQTDCREKMEQLF